MTKNKVDAKRNEKRAKCDFMITKTLIPTLLQKCDPCDILPPAPAQFADSSPEEMNKVSDSKLLKINLFIGRLLNIKGISIKVKPPLPLFQASENVVEVKVDMKMTRF